MRRWLSEKLDDAMLPFLKLISPGYRRRLGPFRPAQPADLQGLAFIPAPDDLQLSRDSAWNGYHMSGYAFSSPYEAGQPEDKIVSGRLLEVSATAPWVVIVPGYGIGSLPPYGYSVHQNIQGRSLLERGMNVALLDPPFHKSRKRRGCRSGEGFFSPDLAQTQHAVRQAAADVVALVRWLERRSDQAVGLWGTSLGGCIAGLVSTLLPDLAGVVLMEPLDNPGDALALLPGSHEIRSVVTRHGFRPGDIPTQLRTVAPSAHQPAIPLEHLLFVTPLWDRVVPVHLQEAFWEAWGRPPRICRNAGHLTLAIDRTAAAAAAEFLAGRLLSPAL